MYLDVSCTNETEHGRVFRVAFEMMVLSLCTNFEMLRRMLHHDLDAFVIGGDHFHRFIEHENRPLALNDNLHG